MLKILLRSWIRAFLRDSRYIIGSYVVIGAIFSIAAIIFGQSMSVGQMIVLAAVLVLPFQFLLYTIPKLLIFRPEPLLLSLNLGKYKDLSFEQEFREDMGAWAEPTVVTLYFGAEVLLHEGHKDFLVERRDRLFKFLDACYDSSTGFYRLSDVSSEASSAQYSHCALGVIKSVSGRQCYDPLGMDLAKAVIGERATNRIAERARTVAGDILKREHSKEHTTLVELYTCYAILRNLERYDLLESLKSEDLDDFLDEHLAATNGTAAFRIAQYHREPCTNATYFAVRLYNIADLPTSRKLESQIGNFLNQCWREKEGGFSSIPTTAATLVHTKMALDIARFLSLEQPKERLERIISFLDACSTPDGFTLAPGFLPNIYACRCALDIMGELRRLGLGSSLENVKQPDLAKRLIARFYDSEIGAFSGYPLPLPRMASYSATA